MQNRKGMSLIGLLLTALIIGLLLKLIIAPYKQAAQPAPGQPPRVQTQSQAKQTLDNVRAQLQEAQRAATKRANYGAGNATK
ncbi:MAG: hypothetical protein MJ053_04475 [Elusimicrobiaceae bacterium]|nr:hypothetical protein [Elusimicrobiaceae bacterium]